MAPLCKTPGNEEPARRRASAESAFTVLELLLVLMLIGFFAVMAAPVIFQLDDAGRAKITQQRLGQIREAIVGRSGSVDSTGRKVTTGYVADMADLPDLYLGEFDKDTLDWSYSETTALSPKLRTDDDPYDPANPAFRLIRVPVQGEIWETRFADPARLSDPGYISFNDFVDAIHLLQPIDLWDDHDRLELLPAGAWKGPYVTEPTDEYSKDTNHLDYANDSESLRREFRMRTTNGRLADGWGRSFIFWPRYGNGATDLWIISEGPDRKSAWLAGNISPTGFHEYDSSHVDNLDNVVAIIHHNEWYEQNVGVRIARTREILEDVRTALLGPRNRFDEQGRPVIGGYVGDLGELPKLYEFNDGSGTWELDDFRGQALALWSREWAEAAVPMYEYGFGWRGPYCQQPWGKTSGEQQIRDAWDRPLIFWRDTDDLWIISEGPDDTSRWENNKYVASEDSDDVFLRIRANEWTPIKQYRIDATERLIESYRVAIRGSRTATHSRAGSPVVGGFTGDFGRMPYLYEWVPSGASGSWSYRYRIEGGRVYRDRWQMNQWLLGRAGLDPATFNEIAYPRELWTFNPVGDTNSANELPAKRLGVGWNDSYVGKPSGSGADEVPRDGWGRPLRFGLTADGALEIVSNGPNGTVDSVTDGDDIGWIIYPDDLDGPSEPGKPLYVRIVNAGQSAWVTMVCAPGDGRDVPPVTTEVINVSTDPETTIDLSNVPPGKGLWWSGVTRIATAGSTATRR